MAEKPKEVEGFEIRYSHHCIVGNVSYAIEVVKNLLAKEGINGCDVKANKKSDGLIIIGKEPYHEKKVAILLKKAIYSVPELNICLRRSSLSKEPCYIRHA